MFHIQNNTSQIGSFKKELTPQKLGGLNKSKRIVKTQDDKARIEEQFVSFAKRDKRREEQKADRQRKRQCYKY